MTPSSSVPHPRWHRVLPALALLISATGTLAEGPPLRGPRADPLDAQAPVPALGYRSPLADYRPLGEDRRTPWREANEVVNRLGGWRSHAREAAQADAPPPAPRPASGAHGGPHPHGGPR